MRRVGLVGAMALQSRLACHNQKHLYLDKLAGKVVGLMLGLQAGLPLELLVVLMRGTLVGLQVVLLVGTLGTGGRGFMKHMTLLLSLLWVL
jgi:hypothetical protein